MAILRHAYALTDANTLVSFNPAAPAVGTPIPVTGLTAGETLVGIDVRPANGLLYGFGVNAATDTATLYNISVLTGVATIVGTLDLGAIGVDLPASGYGFDFNPVVDRIRVTTDGVETGIGLNFRINPNNGLLAGLDVPIVGAEISGVAYTNDETNVAFNGGVTTLYTLDSLSDQLMIQGGPGGPNGGIQIPVGPVGVDFSTVSGFDIPPGVDTLVANSGVPSGSGLALLTVGGGTTQLYSIDLVTGAGTLIGDFLNGITPASGLAILNPPSGADFNIDGRGDILWQNTDGTPAIWLMNGTNLGFAGNVGFNPGPTWQVQDSGDFNGDFNSDILWQNTEGTPAIWLMNGTNFGSAGNVGFNPGPSWQVQDGGDFNGDGKSDILWQNTDGTPAIWLMNGTNVASAGNVGFNPGSSWHIQDIGDFNGDGKSDILWQNTDGTPAIWLMNGTNVVSAGNVGLNPGSSWHIQGTGDFNGDGNSDILWQNSDGTPAIWLMNGMNVVSAENVGFNPGPSWEVEGANDFNGDDRSDILWQNTDGTPAIWFMNGTNLVSVLGAVGPGNPGADWDIIA